jgi:hypothetical protein
MRFAGVSPGAIADFIQPMDLVIFGLGLTSARSRRPANSVPSLLAAYDAIFARLQPVARRRNRRARLNSAWGDSRAH